MLGLKGCVTDEVFASLCNNLHPKTGEQLTPRMRADRRPGFDWNFNVPKSVSLVYAYTKDERIIQMGRQANLDTILEMQERAATRVRANGVPDGDRITGNIVCAEILHLLARPEGGIPDPHLHWHYYVFNMTMDPVEKKWKALQMGPIHDEADYYNRAVIMRLEKNLQSIGLKTVRTKDGFEIEGIERSFIEKFSRRTKTIKATAERLGITDPEQIAKLGAMTRESKVKSLPVTAFEPFWWGSLLPEEKAALEANKTLLQRPRAAELSRQLVGEPVESVAVAGEMSKSLGTRDRLPMKKAVEISDSSDFLGTRKAAKAAGKVKRTSLNQRTRPVERTEKVVEVTEDDRMAVALAMEHIFERQSTATERKLITEAANNWRLNKTTIEGIEKVVSGAPLLRRELNGRMMVTTAEVLTEERRLAEQCRAGLGQWEPMNADWKIEDEKLNEQQRNAVLHVVRSQDLIVGISGKAGTGKTTLLHEAKRAIESGMNKLMVFAPTSEAARNVLRGEGFRNADTVARLLVNEELQREARGAVLWVDEAGLLSNPQMDKLVALTKELGSRLVLVGDTGQHHSVERGQAFEHLEKEGRMKVAHVEEIMRQNGIFKRIVECSAAKDNELAIDLMKSQGDIVERPVEEMGKLAAQRYVQAIKRGESVLAISPTHAECDRVAMAIREELKSQNKLGESVMWPVLKNQSWTDAEKSDYESYSKGMIVQINGHVKGFALGEQVEVVSARDGVVRVRSKEQEFHPRIKALPLGAPKTFSVYQPGTMEICEGEKLRITCNGRTADGHRLSNRNWHTVSHIGHDGKLVLENGWRLDQSFKHLDYAYTMTSHSAQGKTVDRVILVQSAEFSAAADAKQFYVSISRGKRSAFVITDDIELLKENVSVDRHRMMATELMREEPVVSSEHLGTRLENPAIAMDHFNYPEPAKSSWQLGTQIENPAIEIEPECEIELEMEI
jgi:conjugative relaxase-like TrwC/TraI family protein